MIFSGMDLYVYDKDFTFVGIIDNYTSLIWTDRYQKPGEFELEISYNPAVKEILQQDYYCKINYSDHACIIEKIEINQKEDDPPYLVVSGRSLECILARRVVEQLTKFGSDKSEVNLYDSIIELLKKLIIEPENALRLIPNFTYKEIEDEDILKLKFSENYEGDNLLKIVEDICEEKHIGFSVLLDEKNRFVFSLFKGKDRSIEQNTNDYVIFSPYFDNIKTSKYYSSTENYANLMYVSITDDEDVTGLYTVYDDSPIETKVSESSENSEDGEITGVESGDTSGSESQESEESPESEEVDEEKKKKEPNGLYRIEIFENGSKFKKSSERARDDDDKKELEIKIQKRAKFTLLNEYKIQTAFEGDIVPDFMYDYRKNYNVGDRVNFRDAYGNNEVVYISEVVITFDQNGLTILPTFEVIDPVTWEEDEADKE